MSFQSVLLLLASLSVWSSQGLGCDIGRRSVERILEWDGFSRDFTVYIPEVFCERNKYLNYVRKMTGANSSVSSGGRLTVPLQIAIHGFTSSKQRMVDCWAPVCDDMAMVLAAPSGLNNSWNARHCCGESLKHGRDDVGFISHLIAHLLSLSDSSVQQPTDALSQLLSFARFSASAILLQGASNGGFLTELVALHTAVGFLRLSDGQSPFAVASNWAAEIYDPKQVMELLESHSGDTKHIAVAKSMHHSVDDATVRVDGCCHKQGAADCCCGITEHSPTQCFSAVDAFEFWADWNGCNEGTSFESLKSDIVLEIRPAHASAEGVSTTGRCARATPTKDGCDAITELCVYDALNHQMNRKQTLDGTYPKGITQRVVRTFYETICSTHGGVFETTVATDTDATDSALRFRCHCPNDRFGMLCLDLDSSETNQNIDSTDDASDIGEYDAGDSETLNSALWNEWLPTVFVLLVLWFVLVFAWNACTLEADNGVIGVQRSDVKYRFALSTRTAATSRFGFSERYHRVGCRQTLETVVEATEEDCSHFGNDTHSTEALSVSECEFSDATVD